MRSAEATSVRRRLGVVTVVLALIVGLTMVWPVADQSPGAANPLLPTAETDVVAWLFSGSLVVLLLLAAFAVVRVLRRQGRRGGSASGGQAEDSIDEGG